MRDRLFALVDVWVCIAILSFESAHSVAVEMAVEAMSSILIQAQREWKSLRRFGRCEVEKWAPFVVGKDVSCYLAVRGVKEAAAGSEECGGEREGGSREKKRVGVAVLLVCLLWTERRSIAKTLMTSFLVVPRPLIDGFFLLSGRRDDRQEPHPDVVSKPLLQIAKSH